MSDSNNAEQTPYDLYQTRRDYEKDGMEENKSRAKRGSAAKLGILAQRKNLMQQKGENKE